MDLKNLADQMNRLRTRFGPKAFDEEFVGMVIKEVRGMSAPALTRLVDVLIATRPHTKPPLLNDFREARLREGKNNFDRDVHGAIGMMNAEPWQAGLKAFLAKEYPGCKTLNEAVEVRKFKRQILKAEGKDPDAPENL